MDEFLIAKLTKKMNKGSKRAEEDLLNLFLEYSYGIVINMAKSIGFASYEPGDTDHIIYSCFGYYKSTYSVNKGPAVTYFRYLLTKKLYAFLSAEYLEYSKVYLSLDKCTCEDGDPLIETINYKEIDDTKEHLNISCVIDELFKRSRYYEPGTKTRLLRDLYLLRMAGYNTVESAKLLNISVRTIQRVFNKYDADDSPVRRDILKHIKK